MTKIKERFGVGECPHRRSETSSQLWCCCFPSGGDDGSSLPRLPLLPHRVLGLLPVVRLPSGRIRGRPPPSSRSRRRPRLTPEVQGGAERRHPQEEGEESRVGPPESVRRRLRHRGVSGTGPSIPLRRKGQFDVSPNETFALFSQSRTVLSSFPTG